jgi:predicted protein tyrosine phosphatase
MARLYVCPLSRLGQTVEEVGADHVLSVINAGTPVTRPVSIAPERHLFVGVSDVVAPQDGTILPQDAHIREVIAFACGWTRAAPMVIHCYAGVSRSTASAFIAACALRPDVPEARFAQLIRERSPTATPNARFVALADDLLERDGRMIAAIAAIGRGADCFEGVPFHLDLGAGTP